MNSCPVKKCSFASSQRCFVHAALRVAEQSEDFTRFWWPSRATPPPAMLKAVKGQSSKNYYLVTTRIQYHPKIRQDSSKGFDICKTLDHVQPAIRSSPFIWRDQVSECDGVDQTATRRGTPRRDRSHPFVMCV